MLYLGMQTSIAKKTKVIDLVLGWFARRLANFNCWLSKISRSNSFLRKDNFLKHFSDFQWQNYISDWFRRLKAEHRLLLTVS